MTTDKYQITIHIKTPNGISHTLKPIVEASSSIEAIRMVKAMYQGITFMSTARKLN